MERITHREMRNRSGAILRRVEAGESVEVTNNGRLAAIIVPPTGSTVDALIARGEARAPIASRDALLAVDPVDSELSTGALVEDARGSW